MIGRINRWFLTVGIVTAAFGCDNVSWGGIEVGLRGPPEDSLATSPDTSGAVGRTTAPPPSLDLGPLLYAGTRQGDSATVIPVAELAAAGIRPLPAGDTAQAMAEHIRDARLRAGTRLTLFHEGVRIGSMTVTGSGGLAEGHCSPKPAGTGLVELAPSAAEAVRFLALEGSVAEGWPHRPFQALSSAYAQRVASLNLGGEALNEVRARWPERLLDIRYDLQVFPLPGGEAPAVISTFLFRDQLRVGEAPDDAYALLVLGEPRGSGFQRTFTWYRRVGDDGKGAPRFFSRLDWDRDGEEEILLEVLGRVSRWWAALDRSGGSWSLAFQDACGAPGAGLDDSGGEG